MSRLQSRDDASLAALGLGIAAPFLYYGTQLVAAPFYPGYSFLRQAASMLGSDLAVYPAIFNTGAILTGMATLIAAAGFLRTLQRLGTRPILAWLTAIALAMNGIGSIRAGLFPLPDPRHGSGPLLIGMLVLPALLAAAVWRRKDARMIKRYLIATNLLIVAMIPIMSGVAGIDTHGYEGLFQRIATLAIFPPIGAGAYFLSQRIKEQIRVMSVE
jgi:hypothetical membrane protein